MTTAFTQGPYSSPNNSPPPGLTSRELAVLIDFAQRARHDFAIAIGILRSKVSDDDLTDAEREFFYLFDAEY